MADLTTLEEKLAEVTGLAGAAQETMRKMREESEQTESRCVDFADGRDWALPVQAAFGPRP